MTGPEVATSPGSRQVPRGLSIIPDRPARGSSRGAPHSAPMCCRRSRPPRAHHRSLRRVGGWKDIRDRARDGAIAESGEAGARRPVARPDSVQDLGQGAVPVAREDRGVHGVLVLGQRGLVDSERLVSGPSGEARQEGILPGGHVHQVILHRPHPTGSRTSVSCAGVRRLTVPSRASQTRSTQDRISAVVFGVESLIVHLQSECQRVNPSSFHDCTSEDIHWAFARLRPQAAAPRPAGCRADRARREPLALHRAALGSRRGAGLPGALTLARSGDVAMLRCSRSASAWRVRDP
jgi:hypothetical protein